jgi:glycine/D-amino acid oxidase-like deaminating enzyme
MKISISPWLHQMKKDRKVKHLHEDISPDVAIVGAGIAGIATAFFVLRNTDKSVAILEKNLLAHGATGHNAGQLASYFERPFSDIVDEFGLEMAAKGQLAVDNAWSLIQTIYTESGLTIPFSIFQGHAGVTSYEQTLRLLKDNFLKRKAGIVVEDMRIADNADFLDKIPEEYKDIYKLVPQVDILKILETEESDFVASVSSQKGVTNSAVFCQEVLSYLENKYPDRFNIYENTHIHKLVLHKDHALLDAGSHTVKVSKVILCTNGFENITIIDESGLGVDRKFHEAITGVVGYMSGYLERYNKSPTAISYLLGREWATSGGDTDTGDPYFYLTRRKYDYDGTDSHNLICIGGPDLALEDRREYKHDYDYPEDARDEIDRFVRTHYDRDPKKKIEYQFTWHGLMGYTPNKIRLIGPEPKNPVLMYNLGCNGVGILPSIYGGSRISEIVAGKEVEPMIFDPK